MNPELLAYGLVAGVLLVIKSYEPVIVGKLSRTVDVVRYKIAVRCGRLSEDVIR